MAKGCSGSWYTEVYPLLSPILRKDWFEPLCRKRLNWKWPYWKWPYSEFFWFMFSHIRGAHYEPCQISLHYTKKWSFLLRISSKNVTKSAGNSITNSTDPVVCICFKASQSAEKHSSDSFCFGWDWRWSSHHTQKFSRRFRWYCQTVIMF